MLKNTSRIHTTRLARQKMKQLMEEYNKLKLLVPFNKMLDLVGYEELEAFIKSKACENIATGARSRRNRFKGGKI